MSQNTSSDEPVAVAGKGYVSSFPAPGLRQMFRHITGHNEKGESVFLSSDHGDHHRIMGEQQAVANILYSTQETPVEMNGNADLEKARAQEVTKISPLHRPFLLFLFTKNIPFPSPHYITTTARSCG